MDEKQIFISYSRKNRDVALRLYNHLLWEGYWVWMDPRIEEAKKWRPQIDHNLKLSNRCIVLISPEAIDSKWVHHEISMAYGRGQLIIPVKIKDYSRKELPIGIEEIQLFNLVEGEVDYKYGLKKLKQLLGKPLHIQKHLEEMLIHYKTSGMLLTDVALKLYEKHKKEIVWPPGQEALGKELIEKSKRALQKYWARYDNLEKAYINTQSEIDSLKKKNEYKDEHKAFIFRLVSAILISVYIILVLYVSAYLLK
jgi:hypothetical protein